MLNHLNCSQIYIEICNGCMKTAEINQDKILKKQEYVKNLVVLNLQVHCTHWNVLCFVLYAYVQRRTVFIIIVIKCLINLTISNYSRNQQFVFDFVYCSWNLTKSRHSKMFMFELNQETLLCLFNTIVRLICWKVFQKSKHSRN